MLSTDTIWRFINISDGMLNTCCSYHPQVSNPSFFAGSDDPYSLPERLPDVLEFADGKLSITDPSSVMRSESSMSFVSAVSEEGPELSQRGDVFRKALQETVQE